MIDCTENCTLYIQTLVFFKLLKVPLKPPKNVACSVIFATVFIHDVCTGWLTQLSTEEKLNTRQSFVLLAVKVFSLHNFYKYTA